MKLVDSITNAPVIITTGTGGVGKTTMSVALSISIAHEKNARVLVVTIDPAKRLKDVLCEEHLGHEPQKIDHSRFISQPKGELFAAQVETESGWHEIVNRYAHSKEDAQRIFDNNLFKNVTSRFSHSHDFVAMDQLYEYYRSGEYDYIVLDTPPTSQAFGFFDAPQAMSEFFGGKLVRLVTSPYRMGKGRAAKLFDLASQPFFALADKVLGKQFLNDVGEFFFLFHTMYDDFAQRANDITEFLTSSKVNSVLVTNAAQYISGEDKPVLSGLHERKIETVGLIVNSLAFCPEDESNVDDFLKSADPSEFTDFIRRDWPISKKVFAEIQRRHTNLQTTQRDNAIATTTMRRIGAPDEEKRMAQLVESVQSASLMDDTI